MSRNAAKNSMSSERGKPADSAKLNSLLNWQSVTRFVETVMRFEVGVACVDLDSVLLHHNPEDGISRLGHPLPLGRDLTHLLRRHGFKVVVLTSRPADQHRLIYDFLLRHDFAVDDVTNVKPPADAYFDDKGFRIPKNWL